MRGPSTFRPPPLAAAPFEIVQTTACGPAALWLGLLRRMRLRDRIDAQLTTESPISHGQVVEVLVLNRLLSPRPLYRLDRWFADSGLAGLLGLDPALLNDDRLGRTLDAVDAHRADLHAAITMHVITAFDVAVTDIQYDTTTAYLEGAYEGSELAARGHSKDGKADHKQVKLGLATSADGQIPIAHLVVAGNRGDVVTVPQMLVQLRAHVPTSPVVISGDGVMWSQQNMDETARAGGVFLGPIAMIPTVARWVCDAALTTHFEVALTGRTVPYSAAVVSRFSVNGVADAGARIAVFDPRQAAADRRERETAIRRYETALQTLAPQLNQRRLKERPKIETKLGALARRHGLGAKYIAVTLDGAAGSFSLTITRDEAACVESARRDGRWPLVTNRAGLTDAELCQWAVTRYKQHGAVERDMHLLKGPLQLRPVFVQNDARIRALMSVSLWALTAWTLLERAGRKVLPTQRKNVLPIRVRLESLVSTLSIVAYRLDGQPDVYQTITTLPTVVQRELRELGWLHEIRRLLDPHVGVPAS